MKLRASLALLAALATPAAAAADGQSYDFAIIGDVPYNAFERVQLPKLLDQLAKAGNDFVIHAGDIKSGSAPCDDAVLADRLQLFEASPLPLIYTPGDNEWADCGRESAGGFVPRERLARLRALFFTTPRSLGARPLKLTRQGGRPGHQVFVENQRWQRGPVLFVSLHIIGGNNAFSRKASESEAEDYRARESANRAWLAEALALARADKLAALVVVIHGNPRLEAYRRGRDAKAYTAFLEQLDAAADRFDGELVLIHGDTHQQRIEPPDSRRSASGRLARLTRIETYGYPFMGWIQVSVRPGETPLLHFSAHVYQPPRSESSTP